MGQQGRSCLQQAEKHPSEKRQDADVPVHVPLSPIEAWRTQPVACASVQCTFVLERRVVMRQPPEQFTNERSELLCKDFPENPCLEM
ncbi:hypothetical protein KL86DES1_21087 [uncultured Desulfovibrio sp.]|uniref:Uncharacterized protein n=1 Tax=uncultured Desulfovibrio sp. TaxID=167968 RepID=A0A212L6H7_9BACT|nr:hypothetical protein KL86DES1_21087 [uncultured Desulfovibrio sp.]VZH33985.1 conserved protein of unknown function [Desulfovibrio sp. 86]